MAGRRPYSHAHWLIVALCLLALAALPGVRSARNALAAGTVTGVVFHDFNGNGARDTATTIANSGAGTVGAAVDVGVAGVTVTAYDAAGAASGSATTDATGAYSLNLTGAGPYRIEFSNLPAGFEPSAFGPNSATTVQFVPDGNSGNVDLAIHVPGEYCQNNPQLATSCYYFGDPVAGQWANELQLLSFPYAAGAATATTNTVPPYDQPAAHPLAVPAKSVGVTWGLAYQRATKRLFAAAHMKKHSGFGPGGPGAIYTIDTATSAVLNTFTVPGATTNAHNPADYNADNGNTAWDAVGKTALGGVAISDDGSRLYVMNLETRTLYALDATGPALSVAGSQPVPTAGIPTPGGTAATCAAGDVRPFALSFYRGQLYAGLVCSAESTQSAADLFAYVYKVNPATLAFDAAPAFQFALAYPRGLANTLSPTSFAEWRPWTPTFHNLVPYDPTTPRLVYPQPWLTDISFDNGNLVLGLRDRLGDQGGNMAHDDPANPTLLYYGTSAGDILRACGSPGAGWTLESNASCGGITTAGADSGQGPPVGPPAGTIGYGEYYYGDRFATLHDETTIGGTVQVPGYPDVAVNGMDPIPFIDAAGTTYYDGGTRWLSNTSGNHVKAYRLFDGNRGDGKTFGKVSGLGDLVALCDSAPIEIGNRVWVDTNANGVQDPGEPPVAGATVRLYDGAGAPIATSVTDAAGTYYFSGGPGTDTGSAKYNLAALGPNKTYSVRLDNAADYNAGGPLAGLTLTTPNADPSANGDSRDSDAALVGGFPRIDLTTGAAGQNNHTYDVGFVPSTKLSLGNLVWYDTNDNGAVDAGETGAAGVVVRLYADSNADGAFDAGDTQVGGDQVTDASGAYLFTNLDAGDYFVQIPQLNFVGAGKLAGYSNSTGANPGDANNNKDHGVPAPGNGVLSEKVTLTVGGEPTDDGDADPNTNLTIDFGFYHLAVGNQLWRDDNNNGARDAGEPGIPGARVELYDAANALVAATTTGADGSYLFDQRTDAAGKPTGEGLTTGNYSVKIPQSQFDANGPLAGFHSSTGNGEPPPNPNDNLDDRDDGAASPGQGVAAGPFALAPGSPGAANNNVVTPATGSTLNPTIDFGFYTMSLGNLIWRDDNNNCQRDAGEPSIAGLTVRLLDAAGNPVLGPNGAPITTVTNASGHYLFSGLAAGDYVVEVVPPAGYVSSRGAGGACEPAPGADANPADDDDNGTASGTVVRSAPVTLAAGTEPLNEIGGNTLADPAPDASSNLTVDFGLFQPLSLGNQVWRDDNNNGVRDAGEPGMPGVQVCLLTGDGASEIPVGPDGVLGTADDAPGGTTTDANGLYLFRGLPPGDYVAELCAPNFQPGGPLEGYRSSTGKNGSATGPVEPAPDADANPSDGDDNGTTAGNVIRSAPVTLAPGAEPVGENPSNDATTPDASSNLTVDFGVFRPASLGDRVWEDLNRNGAQDAGEPGVPNVTATLHDAATDAPLATTTTDATGFYRFDNLAPGGYYVVFSALPANYVVTLPNATGVADDADSDADAVSGKTGTYTLAAGEYNPTVDAGIYNDLRARLGDRVWYDRNENGVQDAGEPGAPGVVVDLYGKNPAGTFAKVATTTTDANGNYLFGNLLAGDYYVQFARPAGYTLSPRDAGGNTPASDQTDSDADTTSGRTIATTLTPGESDLTWDAGLFYGLVSVGNRVWEDTNNNCVYDAGEPGIAGVAARLYADANDDGVPDGAALASTTTDANGYYLFAGLNPGNYIVQVTRPAGYASSTGANGATAGPCEGPSTPDPDNNLDGRDDGTTSGAVVNARTLTVTRGAEPIGEPTALPNPDTLTPDANSNLTVDFGFYRPLSLGDLVWRDANDNGTRDAGEPGIPGVTVRLFDGDGTTLLATTTTDANGNYLFDNLAPGSYVVEVDRSGPLAGFASSSDIITSPNPDNDVNDDDNGVVVTVTTVRSGVVTLSAGGEPADAPGQPAGNRDRNPTVDFGFARLLALGNQVWRDDNNNGRRDAGEPGIAGVHVCLRTGDGATEIAVGPDGVLGTADDAPGGMLTDASGVYLFGNLPPGDYVVELCGANFAPGGPLEGYTSSTGGGSEPAPSPNNDVNDDDNGTTQPDGTIRSLPVTLAAGTEPTDDGDADPNTNLTVDFGVYPPASLGDLVWLDVNKNGVQDTGEPGVPGVTALLFQPGPDNTPGTADDVAFGTTTTGANGRYQFVGLPAGSYFVQFALPPGYTRSPANQGADDTLDSDADAAGRTPVVTLAPGQNNPTLDAGISFAAGLGDRVWLDRNGNGVQDAGEPGVPGVTVKLFSSTNTQVGSPATTDANGNYAFTGLPPGDYYVEFVPPPGYSVSPPNQGADDAADSDADQTTGRTQVVTLAAGDSNPTLDAGLFQALSLGDLVWNDTNNNGRVGGGEPGLDGVTVNLYRDANGNGLPDATELVTSTTTAGGGKYLFGGLVPGSYIVELPAADFATGAPLNGYVSSSGRPGSNRSPGGPFEPAPSPDDDRNDDDNGTASAAGGVVSRPVTLTAGGEPANDGDADRNTNLTVDFGLFKPASLGSIVWIDTNRDGVREPGEPGVPNVVVTLYNGGGQPLASTTTDGTGFFQFTRLPPGSYQVGFSNLPGGYAFTAPDRGADDTRDSDANPATGRTPLVALAPGQDNPTLYAGLVTIPTAVSLTRFTATWESGQLVVRWQTSEERDTFGFLLLRSATGSRADAVQVTPQTILARGPGSDYSFADATAKPGVAYSYWLVEIETGGARNEYGPITSVGAPAGGLVVYMPLAIR